MSDSTSGRSTDIPAFKPAEFAARVDRARKLMLEQQLDGIVVCSEPNLEYLSGFRIEFAWNTPTRPWYFAVPLEGEPVAVIPEIGRSSWLITSWCKNLMTWASPRPEDEGVSLLKAVVHDGERRFGRWGFETGNETRMGTTANDLWAIRDAIAPVEMTDAVPVMKALRLVKSKAEVAYLAHVCQLASNTFDNLPGFVKVGDTEREICRKFRIDQLAQGADQVPFLAIGTGKGGYHSVISGPTDRRLNDGDIINIDTGAKYGGYLSDFNRNFAVGRQDAKVAKLYDILWRATEAGIAAAVPGATAEDLYNAQARVIEDAGIPLGNVGRFGHGLGKTLTEYPSHKPGDRTVLEHGSVVTIEPSIVYAGGKQVHVHEEDIVVTKSGPVLLTRRAPRELPVIPG